MKDLCNCGKELAFKQNKCAECLIIDACKGTDRKCWNDIIITENFTYIINEDYFFIRNDIIPTYKYFLSPIEIFDYIKIIEQSKRNPKNYKWDIIKGLKDWIHNNINLAKKIGKLYYEDSEIVIKIYRNILKKINELERNSL